MLSVFRNLVYNTYCLRLLIYYIISDTVLYSMLYSVQYEYRTVQYSLSTVLSQRSWYVRFFNPWMSHDVSSTLTPELFCPARARSDRPNNFDYIRFTVAFARTRAIFICDKRSIYRYDFA